MFNYSVGPVGVLGAFTDDFALPGDLPIAEVPAIIERDRAIMATRPGMRQKHLPVRIDEATGNYLSGGRYLFDTFENAQAYSSWVEREFVLDGMKFFDRPYITDPVALVWHVLGAHDFKDIQTQHKLIRFERWNLSGNREEALRQRWPTLQDEAQRRGLASAWLLYNPEHQQAGLVTIADQQGSPDAAGLDHSNLLALESSESLGRSFEEQGWATRIFDRSSWVFTIWFPLGAGKPVEPALWPNSPPLPTPVPSPNDSAG